MDLDSKKSLIKSSLDFGNKLCAYAFLHKSIDTAKKHRLCCYNTTRLSDSNFNSVEMKKIRSDMLQNKSIDGCKGCYEKESKKILSPRQKSIVEFKTDLVKCLDLENQEPIWYDLRISNNCNLACQMCNAFSSSTIAKKHGLDNSYLSYEPDIAINANSKRIYLAGGEPFLIKKFATLLSKITNTDCEIIVNTNATVITKALLNQLLRFQNVNITVSLDGYKEINEKIRLGSNWEEIDSNINQFRELGFSLHANTVLQKDNVYSLIDLGNYLQENGFIKWTIEPVKNRTYFEVTELDQLIIDQLLSMPLVKNNPTTVALLLSLRK